MDEVTILVEGHPKPILGERIQEEPQLAHLLKPVSFTEINVHRQVDLNELNSLCHAYAERAGQSILALPILCMPQVLALLILFRQTPRSQQNFNIPAHVAESNLLICIKAIARWQGY
ncbi:MAG: hypothetical protein ACRBBQ_01180 [Cognatishimia sp.]